MATQAELIVTDNDYKLAQKKIEGYCNHLEQSINTYLGIIEYVLEKGINDHQITAKLNALVNKVDPLIAALSEVRLGAAITCAEFVTEIAETDKIVY